MGGSRCGLISRKAEAVNTKNYSIPPSSMWDKLPDSICAIHNPKSVQELIILTQRAMDAVDLYSSQRQANMGPEKERLVRLMFELCTRPTNIDVDVLRQIRALVRIAVYDDPTPWGDAVFALSGRLFNEVDGYDGSLPGPV